MSFDENTDYEKLVQRGPNENEKDYSQRMAYMMKAAIATSRLS